MSDNSDQIQKIEVQEVTDTNIKIQSIKSVQNRGEIEKLAEDPLTREILNLDLAEQEALSDGIKNKDPYVIPDGIKTQLKLRSAYACLITVNKGGIEIYTDEDPLNTFHSTIGAKFPDINFSLSGSIISGKEGITRILVLDKFTDPTEHISPHTMHIIGCLNSNSIITLTAKGELVGPLNNSNIK